MIQQNKDLDQNLLNILVRCQLKPQITQTQIRSMLQIIVNSIIEIREQKQQSSPKSNENKISIQNLQTLVQSIKKQKDNKVNQFQEKINQKLQEGIKQVKSKLKELETKFQLFCQKIYDQSYLIERRLYQKLSYLLQQMNKKVDIVKQQKIKHSNQKILKNHQQIYNKRQKNGLFHSLRRISIHQQKDIQTYSRKSLHTKNLKQMSEEDSFLQQDGYYQNSYSLVEKQSSLQNVQSFMSTQKITFINQTCNPMIKPIQINIKVQGVKRSCKIKIQTTRMWIALGVLDISQAQKPIKEIGERCAYYCNNKQVWDGRKTSDNQGIGFVTGDTVQISFDLSTKMVQWRVKKKLRHSIRYNPLSFRDNWVPFVYLFNKNDSISVVPYEK